MVKNRCLLFRCGPQVVPKCSIVHYLDEKVFAFRHKVSNWLKEAVEVQSKKSSRSSSSSKHSSTPSKSRSSTKEKAMQEKLQVAELLAEAAFLEKKKTAHHQADEL